MQYAVYKGFTMRILLSMLLTVIPEVIFPSLVNALVTYGNLNFSVVLGYLPVGSFFKLFWIEKAENSTHRQ